MHMKTGIGGGFQPAPIPSGFVRALYIRSIFFFYLLPPTPPNRHRKKRGSSSTCFHLLHLIATGRNEAASSSKKKPYQAPRTMDSEDGCGLLGNAKNTGLNHHLLYECRSHAHMYTPTASAQPICLTVTVAFGHLRHFSRRNHYLLTHLHVEQPYRLWSARLVLLNSVLVSSSGFPILSSSLTVKKLVAIVAVEITGGPNILFHPGSQDKDDAHMSANDVICHGIPNGSKCIGNCT